MTNYTRIPWTDEFSTPTIASLRKSLLEASRDIFDQARAMFLDLDEIEEGFLWFGDCWHWVIVFTLKDHHEDDPLGVIIASPEDLQVAIPMDSEFHDTITTKRMKRMIKDGFELAGDPFHTSWCVWSVNTSSMITDVGQLARQKLRWMLDNY